MFFSFAINTGVLITAKISVQSAADAAAYAGAATQARQLNAISYLNYDMRRQFKKFVYRYAYLGNVASSQFPNDPTGASAGHYGYPKIFHPDEIEGHKMTIPFKVPVVCIPITGTAHKSDNCVKLNLPSTVAQTKSFFPNGGLTAITQAFLQSAADISRMQGLQCGKTSAANLFVLVQWLMRGDITDAAFSQTLDQMTSTGNLSDQNKADLKKTIQHLVDGLGLYPRNIITMMRILTLEKLLNATAKKDIQKDTVDSFEADKTNAEMNERTIQAFKSALSNLNNEVISHDSVIMQELQTDHQITLNEIKPSFNAYVQYMNNQDLTDGTTICNAQIIAFKAKKAPAGVVKTPGTPVHYAVKIKATAKLLFLPIKDGIELEAFASAKPFGSRIGPANLSESDFVENIRPSKLGNEEVNDCSDASVSCNVPNLKITNSDTFYSPGYLVALSKIGTTVNSDGSETFTFPGGMANSIAPQPYEVGHYNILPRPASVSDMAYEFIPYSKDQNSKIYRFYAPIFTGAGNPTQKITDFMDEVFGTTSVSGQTNGNFNGVDMLALKSTIQGQIIAYVNGPLMSGKGSENEETTTFAAIELPMVPATTVSPSPQKYWLTESKEVLSSWAPLFTRTSSGVGFKPRFGYSVKFVAMQDLLQAGMNESDSDEGNVSH